MDDYIKRKDAIRYAQWEGAYKAVINIENLPHEDVQPVCHGKWEERTEYNGWGDTYYHCSECGNDFYFDAGNPTECEWNFCPRCGVDMRVMKNYKVKFDGSIAIAAHSLEEAEDKFITALESALIFSEYDYVNAEAFEEVNDESEN